MGTITRTYFDPDHKQVGKEDINYKYKLDNVPHKFLSKKTGVRSELIMGMFS